MTLPGQVAACFILGGHQGDVCRHPTQGGATRPSPILSMSAAKRRRSASRVPALEFINKSSKKGRRYTVCWARYSSPIMEKGELLKLLPVKDVSFYPFILSQMTK